VVALPSPRNPRKKLIAKQRALAVISSALSFTVTSGLRYLPLPNGATAHCVSLETVATLAGASDEVLIASVQTGDRDALALLFRRYALPIRNVGQRILRDKAEADDLVQEVFLYVHRKSSLYDSSKGSARSWIFQIAYTQAFLRRRQMKSHGLYASGIADKSPEIASRTSSGADYDQSVEGLFGRNGWRGILDALTEEQSETLRLHFFEGYTFAEIAEKLGQSLANVRNHHYRGLEKLRKYLSDNELNR
jgi:RNA polymerase sigma-70 factor (ECF subfamily)